jgi:transposase-like protein
MRREESPSPEAMVREIRRKTRRKFPPEEKIRVVLERLEGDEARQARRTRPGTEGEAFVWCVHKRQFVVK